MRRVWFGDEFGKSVITAYIDTATGTVVGSVMTESEGLTSYREAFRQVLRNYGVPSVVVTDGCTTFDRIRIAAGDKSPSPVFTQMQEIFKDLNVIPIKAETANGKPRIERWWDTCQTRLPYEFRLLGISTIAEANRALPALVASLNKRFGVLPFDSEPAWRQPPADIDIVLATRNRRRADGGNSFQFRGGRRILIDASGTQVPLKKGEVVSVLVKASGEVSGTYRGRNYRIAVFHSDGRVTESLNL